MHQDFGSDMVSAFFTGTVNSSPIAGPSVWMGEMSIFGIVPPGDTITIGGRPYAF